MWDLRRGFDALLLSLFRSGPRTLIIWVHEGPGVEGRDHEVPYQSPVGQYRGSLGLWLRVSRVINKSTL